MEDNLDQNQLTVFLVEAKRSTYLAQGHAATVAPALPGARQLEFFKGEWSYRDLYFGGEQFAGLETVYYAGRPVWAMSYAGGMTSGASTLSTEVYAFLRAALLQVSYERPFRGPSLFERGRLVYTDASVGGVNRFFGTEVITLDRAPVYQLRYAGGLLH